MLLSLNRSMMARPIARRVVRPRATPILTDIVVGVIALSVIVDVAKTLYKKTNRVDVGDDSDEDA